MPTLIGPPEETVELHQNSFGPEGLDLEAAAGIAFGNWNSPIVQSDRGLRGAGSGCSERRTVFTALVKYEFVGRLKPKPYNLDD